MTSLLSAANMKLKLLRLDDAERLYERAWGMAELTAAHGEKKPGTQWMGQRY